MTPRTARQETAITLATARPRQRPGHIEALRD